MSDVTTEGPSAPARGYLVLFLVVSVLAVVGLVAWAVAISNDEPDIASLCDEYQRLQDAGAEVRAIDVETTSASEAEDAAGDYLAAVREMQQVADGRYAVELENLEFAVNDVLRTLESIPADADDSTWMPLVEDSVDDAVDAAATVRNRIGPTCEEN